MEKNKGFMCVMSSGSASLDSQKTWSDVLWGAGWEPEEEEHISTWPHTDHRRNYTTRHPVKSSTWECDVFLHPPTSKYNVHAWLDNRFLMVKLNMILDIWNYLVSLVDFVSVSIFNYFYYLLLLSYFHYSVHGGLLDIISGSNRCIYLAINLDIPISRSNTLSKTLLTCVLETSSKRLFS